MAEPIRLVRGGVVVPTWGNGDRPDDEKITVHYRFLTFEEQQQMLDPAELGKSFAYESKVLAAMIGKVENLEIEVDGEVTAITDGAGVVGTAGLDELALELWLTLKNRSAVDKKKSSSESGSG